MSAITILRDLCLSRPAVVSIVGSSIFPLDLPQGEPLPALVLSMVDERDDRLLTGQARYPVARFIVDCLGTTFAAADVLGDLLKGEIGDWRGPVGGFHADFALGDVDHHDRGEAGTHYRRRLGLEARFRAI